jgi:ferrochelatase
MIGVLVMAYGGPNNLDEVEPYLLDVRGGRPTSAEIVTEIRERYRQIGGSSPILRLTRAQADALETELNQGGSQFQTFVGMRHWRPYIQDALRDMQAHNIDRAVGLVMAPHYSRMSVDVYYQKVSALGSPVELAPIQYRIALSHSA